MNRLKQSKPAPSRSFLRKQESWGGFKPKTPAFAGVTEWGSRMFVYGFAIMIILNNAHSQIPNLGPGIPDLTVNDPGLLWTQTLQVNNPRDVNGRKAGMNVSHLYKGYAFLILGGDGHHTAPRAIDLLEFVPEANTLSFKRVKTYYTDETQMLGESHSFGFFTKDGIDFGVFHTEEGIAIWDLTDVNSFSVVSRLNIGGIFQTNYDGTAFGVFAQWPYAYVAGSNTGLRIVNISDPANPYVAKTLTVAETGLAGRLGFCYAIGNLLVISAVEGNGWSLMDISRPSAPVLMYANTDDLTYHANLYGDRIHVLGRNDETLHTFKMKKMEDYVFGDDQFVVKESAAWGIPYKAEYLYFNDGRIYIGAGEIAMVGSYNTSTYEWENYSGYMFLSASKANEGHPIPFGNFTFVGDDHGTGSGLFLTDRLPDKVSPHAALTVPADGSTGRSIASRVGVQYSSMITVESVSSESFTVKKKSTGEVVPGVYSVWQNYANFAPLVFFETSTEYEVTLTSGVTDWSGNPAESVTFSFTTSDFDESTLPVDPDREPVDTLFTLPTTERFDLGTIELVEPPRLVPIIDSDSLLARTMYQRIWASSIDGAPYNVIDGQGYGWLTRNTLDPPHSLYFQLREPVTLTSMIHKPTTWRGGHTGQFEIYIGSDSASSQKVYEGDFLESTGLSQVHFTPTMGQFIEFRVLTSSPTPDSGAHFGIERGGAEEMGFLGDITRPTNVQKPGRLKIPGGKQADVYYDLSGRRIHREQLQPNNIYILSATGMNKGLKIVYTRQWRKRQ